MSAATETRGTSFGQTEIWIDRQGVEHRVDEMSVRYKANVVRFIERRASNLVTVDADKYPDEVEGMLPDLPKITNAEAVDLVRRTPLMKRLIEDIEAGRGGDDA